MLGFPSAPKFGLPLDKTAKYFDPVGVIRSRALLMDVVAQQRGPKDYQQASGGLRIIMEL